MSEGQPTNLKEKNKYSFSAKVHLGRFLLAVSVLTLLNFGCNDRKELVDQELYAGPLSSLDSINTLLSDSGKLVMHMMADRQNNYENGDKEWPEGLFLESYGDDGSSETVFKANYVYYFREDNLYRAEGNVIVQNLANGDELNTEELYWKPDEEEFYTEKYVTIRSDDEVHTGEGLQANQDFTSYKILSPSGSFVLEESATSYPQEDI